MDIKGVMSDEKFDALVARIGETYKQRIKKGGVSKIATEIYLAVAELDGDKRMISTFVSDLPSDKHVLHELLKQIGYRAAEHSHALPYAAVMVSEAWVNDGEGEAVVIYGAVADKRTRRYRIIVERDSNNDFRYVSDNWGVFGHEADILYSIFEGVADYVAERVEKVNGSMIKKLAKLIAGEIESDSDVVLSRPERVEFSKN